MSDEPTSSSSYTENDDSEISGDGATAPVDNVAATDSASVDTPSEKEEESVTASMDELEETEVVTEEVSGFDEMDELRRILLGDTSQNEADIHNKINQVARLEVEGQLEEISKALPEAIIWHKTNSSSKLANALSPTIEETLTLSVQRNPKPLADAIFPVIGPAIRKSIREALKSMMDSVNNVLEHSFSPRSIRWRIEALTSGKKFSEVLLAHTLEFRVEQIFLIERNSGVLIQHVHAEDAFIRDGDVVSGMLRAVQAFVKDTLEVSPTAVLDSVDIDGVKIIVEPGPQAILAAVISGLPEPNLKEHLQEIIENIHLIYGYLLENFDGDEASCEPVVPLLKTGLVTQFKEEEQKPPVAAWILIYFLSIAFIVWMVLSFINLQRWNGYLDALRQEPGIIVTETGWKNGKWVVEGLYDPMAPHPSELRPENIPEKRILSSWQPYMAMDSAFVLKRAEQQLKPPTSVEFTMREGTLVAAGQAPLQWIEQTRERSSFIPGIAGYDDTALRSSTAQTEAFIENATINFSQGSDVLDPDQAQALREISRAIQSLISSLGEANVTIDIYGYTSAEGTEAMNLRLSQDRADAVREALVAHGITRGILSAQGMGRPRNEGPENTEEARRQNRSVVFVVQSDQ